MARPTKLTSRVQDIICEALRNGASQVDACRAAGIGESTLHEWLARGRSSDRGRPPSPSHVEFAAAVDAALAAPASAPEASELTEPPEELSVAGASFPESFPESAGAEYSDAHQKNARAGEQKEPTGPVPEEVSPRAWLSEKSRGRLGQRSVADQVF